MLKRIASWPTDRSRHHRIEGPESEQVHGWANAAFLATWRCSHQEARHPERLASGRSALRHSCDPRAAPEPAACRDGADRAALGAMSGRAIPQLFRWLPGISRLSGIARAFLRGPAG